MRIGFECVFFNYALSRNQNKSSNDWFFSKFIKYTNFESIIILIFFQWKKPCQFKHGFRLDVFVRIPLYAPQRTHLSNKFCNTLWVTLYSLSFYAIKSTSFQKKTLSIKKISFNFTMTPERQITPYSLCAPPQGWILSPSPTGCLAKGYVSTNITTPAALGQRQRGVRVSGSVGR